MGLNHYKARAYSPTLGRFMQTDPIGYAGGINLYGYTGNDPVNATDPLGLCYVEGVDQPRTCPRPSSDDGLFGRGTIGNGWVSWRFDDDLLNRQYCIQFYGNETCDSASISDEPTLTDIDVTTNRLCHDIAVAAEGLRLMQMGFIVTPSVTFADADNRRLYVVADLVASDPTFPLPNPRFVIEVKTGEGELTRNQSLLYPGERPLRAHGFNALRAGFWPGERVQLAPLGPVLSRYGSGSDADCARYLGSGGVR